MLPWDIIRVIQGYLPWRDRTTMVSRRWLIDLKLELAVVGKWASKMRLYSYVRYLKIGGSLESVCRFLFGIHHRKLNVWTMRCSWQGAMQHYLSKRCQACGRLTRSHVMNVPICGKCRFNRKLKWTFMVKTYEARRFATRRQLRDLPYHVGKGCTHLRFWTDVARVAGVEDNRVIRNRI